MGRSIRTGAVTGVWYRRPAEFTFPPEFTPSVKVFAEEECRDVIMGLWEILDTTWVNHPQQNRNAELKIRQLKIANEVGLEIPKTLITNDPGDAESFFRKSKKKGVIVKRLGGGIMLDGQNGSALYTSLINTQDIKNIERVKYTPTLFQEYIPKDVELRITVVGNKIFPVEIYSQKSEKAKVDWRKDTLNLVHREHKLPIEIEQKLLIFVKKLGLNFGAIDMILTPSGKYVFLEINPNGQWGWIEDLTGMPISESIIELLTKGGT